jgi:hypothetical protein
MGGRAQDTGQHVDGLNQNARFGIDLGRAMNLITKKQSDKRHHCGEALLRGYGGSCGD